MTCLSVSKKSQPGVLHQTHHVAEDESNGPPVADCQFEGFNLADALLAHSTGLDPAFSQTCNSDGAFSFSEARAGGWEIEEDE